jgi:hypothetical protein
MRHLLAVLILLSLAACGPSSRAVDDDTGDDDTAPDATSGPPDAQGECPENVCQNPVVDGCGAAEICGNGLDDDCNGAADEHCGCTAGAVQPCFVGPPGRRDHGACVDGTQRCVQDGELAFWGDCTGGIFPSAEACDSQDNDCNGCADDSSFCCDVSLRCPGPGDLPDAQPFAEYVIDGTQFFSGPTNVWHWTVSGGPCDQLLAPAQSFTLLGDTTPMLRFTPTLSGDYTVHLDITLPDGSIISCDFIVHVVGPGLRVELCWDTDGQADIDLHVHQPDSSAPYFDSTGDCFYGDCKVGGTIDWGYAPTPLAECDPQGLTWSGSCRNPRLDLDNISVVGKPENVNIDKPVDGKTYRVAVHYYGGGVSTHPLINIYCGGRFLATYGAAPDVVPGFSRGGGYQSGTMWRVVDVLTHVDGLGVTTGCDLAPLHPDGQSVGYRVSCPDNSCSDMSY